MTIFEAIALFLAMIASAAVIWAALSVPDREWYNPEEEEEHYDA